MAAIEWPEFRSHRRARYYRLIGDAVKQMKAAEPIRDVDPSSYAFMQAFGASSKVLSAMNDWLERNLDERLKKDRDLHIVRALMMSYTLRALVLFQTGDYPRQLEPGEKEALALAVTFLGDDPDLVDSIGASAGAPVTFIHLHTASLTPSDKIGDVGTQAFNCLWSSWIHPRVKSPLAKV